MFGDFVWNNVRLMDNAGFYIKEKPYRYTFFCIFFMKDLDYDLES